MIIRFWVIFHKQDGVNLWITLSETVEIITLPTCSQKISLKIAFNKPFYVYMPPISRWGYLPFAII